MPLVDDYELKNIFTFTNPSAVFHWVSLVLYQHYRVTMHWYLKFLRGCAKPICSIVCNIYVTHPVFLFGKQHISDETFLPLARRTNGWQHIMDQLTWIYSSFGNVVLGNIQKREEKPIFNSIDFEKLSLKWTEPSWHDPVQRSQEIVEIYQLEILCFWCFFHPLRKKLAAGLSRDRLTDIHQVFHVTIVSSRCSHAVENGGSHTCSISL